MAQAHRRSKIPRLRLASNAPVAARCACARSGRLRRAFRARGLLAKHVEGQFDLATNEALAAWERKNDIFGWGFLGGETLAALQRPPLDLHFDTFRRILMERVADAAGIIEDGSVSGGDKPATYKDAAGVEHPVPNLIADYTDALMAGLGGPHHRRHAQSPPRVPHPGAAEQACAWPSRRPSFPPTTAARWTFPSRSIAAMSGTTSPSMKTASPSCSRA